jgi:hypothetical protein
MSRLRHRQPSLEGCELSCPLKKRYLGDHHLPAFRATSLAQAGRRRPCIPAPVRARPLFTVGGHSSAK